MCGRFTMTASRQALLDAFRLVEDAPEAPPRYNICPTQPVMGLVEDLRGRPQWRWLRWGLIPAWAKEMAKGPPLINARAETVESKPAFRGPFRHHRCLIPADGFYEWQAVGGGKQPFLFRLAGGGVFALAGLWDTWLGADGSEIDSCAVVTTTPNDLLQRFHDRMPVILAPDDHRYWLGAGELPAAERARLFAPFPSVGMTATKVDRRVGSPSFDSPACLEPVP
ncbi:MAG: SOS response-associated peptidase [Candidatus Riflebacteria bacterium]|nr:SOS response-associated peptidase [Candidatus Riflebacteria bacterium]